MPTRPFLTLFFLSGCTSLIYELVFHKLLAYVFGSSTLAVTTVLVAFMGGLAIGGRAFGALADRTPRPVALYASLELAIGGYVLFVPFLLDLCARAYVALGVTAEIHSFSHVLIRFVLSVVVLALPTVLMGATLPLLARALVRSRNDAERDLSRLYGINTLGAATGTLLANYVLLRYLGIYGALGLGALANAWIFFRARRLERRYADAVPASELLAAPTSITAQREAPKGDDVHSADLRLWRVAIVTAFITGACSFVYEIVWTHLLATIVGTSVYAFGLMLATFLFGLALGSLIVSRGVRADRDRLAVIAVLQLVLGGYVLATLPLWDELPFVFQFVGQYEPGFVVRELTRGLVCAAVLLVPCTAIGATFPLLMRNAASLPNQLGRRVGLLYATNTLGCIVGAVATGFFLLEAFGSRSLLLLSGCASLLLGFVFLVLSPTRRPLRTLVAIGYCTLAVAIPGALYPAWDLTPLAAGMNVHFSRGAKVQEVLYAAEDPQGGFTTVTREARGITLRTNGKYQGDDKVEMEAQSGFALIPLLLLPRYGTALNIGYGTGVTAGVLSRFPFERIEIAELSPSIVRAADRYFSQINFGVTKAPRTALFYNDGRNHLLVSKRSYDLISVELTSVWFAGAAALYSKEFYELCRARLSQGGVLQQWVQLHHITRTDLLVLWHTLHSVFPNVSLWRQGSQGLLIATEEPQVIDYAHVAAMNAMPMAQPVRARLRVKDFFALLGAEQLDPQAMNGILGELAKLVPRWALPWAVSSDLYPYLEYSTPQGYAGAGDTAANNLRWISGFSRRRLATLTGVPSAGEQRRVQLLAAAWSDDCATVLRLAPNLDGTTVATDAASRRAFVHCERARLRSAR